MNVVIYARYSSDRQTEQSIEGQLKECYEYARRNGYTIVGEYIDRAISGTTDHRPEFLRMIADGDKKLFQAVLVYQLDRFARNRYDSATYKAKLKKNGIRVLSARENISDDAADGGRAGGNGRVLQRRTLSEDTAWHGHQRRKMPFHRRQSGVGLSCRQRETYSD